MGVNNLSDVMSETTVETTTENNADEDDELPEIFAEIGADEDRVRQFRENQSDNFGELTSLAEALADDDDLWALHEEYRQMVDLHRINVRYLRGEREGEFMDNWRNLLYGDSDDPKPGTKNDLQNRIQGHDLANLPRYKVMFPEPVEDYFPGDPVKWSEGIDAFDPITLPTEEGQDSHIWVASDFVESYSDYALEIDGMPRPLPPGDVDETTPPIDPSEYTVDELKDRIAEIGDEDTLEAVYEAESRGKDRKTAKQAIEAEMGSGGNGGSGGITLDEDAVEALREAGIDVEALA